MAFREVAVPQAAARARTRAPRSGLYVVTYREAVAAARTQVAVDKVRGVPTDPKIVALAS